MRWAAVGCFLSLMGQGGHAEIGGFRPLADWPLGDCTQIIDGSELCLNGPDLWHRFGHGAPEIETAVVETWETHAMAQILTLHPWLAHLEIPTFWHVQRDEDLTVVDGQILPDVTPLSERQSGHVAFCKEVPAHPTCVGVNVSGQTAEALAYLGWEGRANHELKMIGLIGGQDVGSMRRSGVAPLGSVSLHYIETTSDVVGLRQMAARLNRRPGTRVVNFSNEGPDGEMLDLQYDRIYQTTLAMNAGQRDRTGANPTDRLLVASSANTTGTTVKKRALPKPNRFVPPEAVVPRAVLETARPADARAAHVLRPKGITALVVGGIGPEGQLYGLARLEPMIDLYAPGGRTEAQIAQLRSGRSTLRRARQTHGAVQSLMSCQPVDSAVSGDGVATLDWGPRDDIRSSVMMTKASLAQRFDLPALGDLTLGCQETGGILFAHATGNSVSTALVSGVAAQMFALDPQLSAREAREILIDTARHNRVNGVPVLAAHDALQTVLTRFVDRYVARSVVPRARGQRVPLRLRPAVRQGTLMAGRTALSQASVMSRSIAPGAFGQSGWRDMRQDPPLDIRFDLQVIGPARSCHAYHVILQTDAHRQGNETYRRVRAETVVKRPNCRS